MNESYIYYIYIKYVYIYDIYYIYCIYYIYIIYIYIYIYLKMNRRKILEHLRMPGTKLKTIKLNYI